MKDELPLLATILTALIGVAGLALQFWSARHARVQLKSDLEIYGLMKTHDLKTAILVAARTEDTALEIYVSRRGKARLWVWRFAMAAIALAAPIGAYFCLTHVPRRSDIAFLLIIVLFTMIVLWRSRESLESARQGILGRHPERITRALRMPMASKEEAAARSRAVLELHQELGPIIKAFRAMNEELGPDLDQLVDEARQLSPREPSPS